MKKISITQNHIIKNIFIHIKKGTPLPLYKFETEILAIFSDIRFIVQY